MPFTDNFTGTAGQLLSARTGWSFLFGDNTITIGTTGTSLSRGTTATSTPQVYLRDDDGSLSQAVGCDFLGSVGSSWGPLVMASGTSLATFNGYWMRPQTGGTSARVYRITNGVVGGSPILTVSGLTNSLQLELRCAVSGGNAVLSVWSAGVQVGSSYTDSSVNKNITGQRGLYINVAGSLASSPIDNWFDNYTAGINLVLQERTSRFFEGIRNTTPAVFLSGTYSTTPTSIEARLEDAAGAAVSGFDWATKVATPSGGVFTVSFAAVPVGGPYTVAIRDSAVPATVVRNSNGLYVGAVIMPWGQSQNDKLGSSGAGLLSAATGMKVFYSCPSDKTIKDRPSTLKEVLTNAATIGNGIVAWANQWHADSGGVPLLIQDCTVPGSGITAWINDIHDSNQGADLTNLLWSNFATAAFVSCDYQASAIMWMQGTNDVGSWASYAANMELLKTKFNTALSTQNPLYCVTPHQRSNDTEQTWNMRNAQYGKAVSGGTWRLASFLLDWEMGANASPHQSTNAQGNPRGGYRIGRAMARLLVDSSIESPPQVVSATFTSPARTAFDVVFSADIEAADGTTTTGLPGHFASLNSGTTWPALSNLTAAITGARTVRMTSTVGALPAATTRYDLLRGTPFSSDGSISDYIGAESGLEASTFAKLLTSTSSFESGRGLPARPVMGTGMAVSELLPIICNGGIYNGTLRVGAL